MDPITIGLLATTAIGKIGSLFGPKRKPLDMEQLKQLFGAKAITEQQMELFNRAIASPQGIQMLSQAAQAGQNFQTDVARGAASAGLGGGEGMSSGADIFSNAAGAQAAGNLQREVRGNLMQAMLPVAQQLVSDRMQAWLADRNAMAGQTTRFQDIMGSVGDLGANLLAARQASQATGGGTNTTTTASDTTAAAQPAGAAPTPMQQTNAPAGAAAVVGAPQAGAAMPPAAMQAGTPLTRRRMQGLLGGGRFARAMSANRFGAVQVPAPAYNF